MTKIILGIITLIVIASAFEESSIIRYSLSCKDPNLVAPSNVTCPGETFSLVCSPLEVVVATVCFGSGGPDSRCRHEAGNCLDGYTSSFDAMLPHTIEECLWNSNECEFETGPNTYTVKESSCQLQPLLTKFSYIGGFSFQCVNASIVHDVCATNSVFVSGSASSIGYVMSPNFPSKTGDKNCSKTFRFGGSDVINVDFLIQHVQLEENNGDFVRIGRLNQDESVVFVGSWTSIVEYESLSLETEGGFVVTYQISGQLPLRGFLLSFNVSETARNLPATSYAANDVTKDTIATETPVLGGAVMTSQHGMLQVIYYAIVLIFTSP